MKTAPHNGSIVCALTGAEHVKRRHRWEELCRRSLIQRTNRADGVELHFSRSPPVEAELRSLVVLERSCCSFARWELSASRGKFALHISAAPDAVVAVQALFDAAPSVPA